MDGLPGADAPGYTLSPLAGLASARRIHDAGVLSLLAFSESMGESSKRSAHATIRGYLYQTCLGVRRWLDLQPNEILVCEGDEDLDRHILEGESVFEQVKDYSGGLGLADPAVKETLGHFLVRYVDLRKSDRASRFVFTTTARPKRRQADKDLDLLDAWRNGDRGNKVLAGVRALFKDSKNKDIPKGMTWLSRQKAWAGFLDAVEWSFDAPDLDKIRGEIRDLLARRDDTRALPAETFTALSSRYLARRVATTSATAPSPRNACRPSSKPSGKL